MTFDVQTVEEQKAWEHYAKLEAENYHLKKQLARVNKENKSLKYHNRELLKYKKQNEQRKERYRNNGKKRTINRF